MDGGKLLIIIVYVDDIIFGSNEESMSQRFASIMQQEFEMYLLGEVTYFLGYEFNKHRMTSSSHKQSTLSNF